MREFTKEHDIVHMFPSPNKTIKDKTKYAKTVFDFYEQLGQDKLQLKHNNKKTFSADEMLDAFLIGASMAHQFNLCELYGLFDKYDENK